MAPKRILIVGGVAGGASCAARARRVDEAAEIVIFERGPFVSFANCGLPYHVGGVIEKEQSLLVASPALLRDRFRIDVRTGHEVVSIDRAATTIEVREVASGRLSRERYDALVLSPGAAPIVPPLPGVDLPGVFCLRTIPDARKIREWITARGARTAVVVGAGFIGLEMVESFVALGLAVTVIEKSEQVLPPLDPELARPVAEWLREKGVRLRLGEGLTAIERVDDAALRVVTSAGPLPPADLVLLGVGVRPEVGLARDAGLELGARGGIRVDAAMRTSDPKIWAIGDAVEVRDTITGQWGLVPLAGPANRQGRIAADAIAGRAAAFRGVQATAICTVLGFTAGTTGASERTLVRAGVTAYEKVYVHAGHHAGYFPGARTLHLKLLFATPGGRLLGAQAVGEEGVDKRIDVLAMAIQMGASVFDLEAAELAYAPPFGSAKDPVNLLGMVAANALRGDAPLARWEDVGKTDALLLDVRQPEEVAKGAVPGAVPIPLPALRDRSGELPRDRELWVFCRSGQRSYAATRILRELGFRARNLGGGHLTYEALGSPGRPRPGSAAAVASRA